MQKNRLGHNIRFIIRRFRLTKKRIAEALGVSVTTIGRWERYEVDPQPANLRDLAGYFTRITGLTITTEDLETRELSKEFGNSEIAPAPSGLPSWIPLISHADAGEGHDYSDQGYGPGSGYEHIDRPPSLRDRNAYAIQIVGESMVPMLNPGDRVVVSPNREFLNGKVYVVRRMSGEVIIKRVRRREDQFICESVNPAEETVIIAIDQVRFLHMVVWHEMG
jgi:phage repressor protein C with HTH and peptisase S24 domain